MDNTAHRLLGRHFPERVPTTERKLRPTKCVTRTTRGRRQCFNVLIVQPVGVLRAASRLTTQSSTIKIKIYFIYKNFNV
jgi:hypothetical protein